MEKEYTDQELNEQINNNSDEAEKLLEDENKLERFLERFERKLTKVPMVGNKLSNVPMLISLVRSYVHKEYRDIPIGTIIAILGALIYFVSPIDLLPDVIPVAGYFDDIAVLVFALKMVNDDIEEYKAWQKDNSKRIIKD